MTTTARRGAMLRAVALAALLTAACDMPTVPPRSEAYDFMYDGPSERLIYRWPDGAEIGVYVVPMDDDARNAELEAAFAHAAEAWNDVVLFGEYRIVRAPLDRADVVLAWANSPLPLDTSGCPPFGVGSAWTTFCADLDFTQITAYPLLEGDHREDGVHMIVHVIDDPQTEGHLAALVTHEFGHVLGIGRHPCRLGEGDCGRPEGAQTSIMYEGIPGRSTPSTADRATVELLYHTRPHLTP